LSPLVFSKLGVEMIQTTDINGALVWAYVINGMEIVDPYISECGRFDVTPDYYGLTVKQAAELAEKSNIA
jgi:hypothetical protein